MNPIDLNCPSGIVLLDKPEGMTSAKAVAVVKKVLKANKAGHAGTLDPFATGLLICCINQATRLAQFFQNTEKTYQATMHLGVETDTGDLTGKPVSVYSGTRISEEKIRSAFRQFTGNIRQSPPVFSALKHQGIPLYRWARRGRVIQKPPRTIFIRQLTVIQVDYPKVLFEVTCSAGTYIRSLGVDVGKVLGCGGHLSQLRRIRSGGFHVDAALPLSHLHRGSAAELTPECVLPMAEALGDLPALAVDDAIAEKLRYGRSITEADMGFGFHDQDPRSCIKVIDKQGGLLAVLNRNENGSFGYCGVFQP